MSVVLYGFDAALNKRQALIQETNALIQRLIDLPDGEISDREGKRLQNEIQNRLTALRRLKGRK